MQNSLFFTQENKEGKTHKKYLVVFCKTQIYCNFCSASDKCCASVALLHSGENSQTGIISADNALTDVELLFCVVLR